MQQAVQEVKDAKDAECKALTTKHEELASIVASLAENVAAQNSSNSAALQVCCLHKLLSRQKLIHKFAEVLLEMCLCL